MPRQALRDRLRKRRIDRACNALHERFAQPTTVWVTNFEYKHGNDMAVFDSAEKAEQRRQELAAECWDQEMGEAPRPADPVELADVYWHKMLESGYEFFSVDEYEVL